MSFIRVLPEQVIAKIAAGEVVERPASVVKELIDNAIDAGATSVEVDVVSGGKKRITVIDNGCGMDEHDARFCVERHATSKISSEADLSNIRTMGFRGEALTAIAAISKLQVETKPLNSRTCFKTPHPPLHPLPSREGKLGFEMDPNQVEGTFISVEGGVLKETRPAGCPSGTRINVSDLFFNVPARKKFLKSDSVEYGHVADIIYSMALANVSIRFELSHNGEPKIRCHRVGDIKNRIEDVLGDDVRNSIYEFAERGAGIELNGFMVKDGLTRATARDIYFFVNGRPVKDRILQHALLFGFETFLPRGEYPIAVLYLTIDPSIVDVNVHPTKREVRFANSGMVHDFVAASVRKAVTGRVVRDFTIAMSGGGEATPSLCKGGMGRVDLPPLTPPYKGGEDFRLRVLGQFDRAFIVCEGEDGNLVLIDQHAAHERLGFESLKEQLAKGSVEEQRLLLPEQLKLTSKEASVILEHKDIIETAGFEMEHFGGESVVIKAVPAILGDVSLQSLFEKIASELSLYGSSNAADTEIDKILSVVACHRQVRAGDLLTNEEMQALVGEMERASASFCPHGRPAIVTIERSEVDKWFKRA